MKSLTLLFVFILLLALPVAVTAQDTGNDLIYEITSTEYTLAYFPVPDTNCTEFVEVYGTMTVHLWARVKSTDPLRVHMHTGASFVSDDGNYTAQSGFNIIQNSISVDESGNYAVPNVTNMVGSSEFYDPDGLIWSIESDIVHVTLDENGVIRVRRIDPTIPITCHR